MPPKKIQQPNKKTEQKKKEKIIEDKTFGLKNKKGNKQQTYIKSVQSQVKYGNQKASKLEEQKEKDRKTVQERKKKEQDELNKLFRPTQKVAKGVDPKSVVCAFFKQGSCTKGDKCKFSHDLTLERKAEKRSMYDDAGEEKADTMDSWDEAKLKEVVDKKHGEADKQHPKTNIVCKYFVKAIEDMKYGWFWTCPNGDKCMYKHVLPPGFVLKKPKKDDEEEEEKISLEELIEQERTKLSAASHTKITLESFQAWKKKKIEEKKKKLAAEMSKKKQEFKQGKSLGITGRELFQFNPDMVIEEDTEGDDVMDLRRENDEEEQDKRKVVELTIEALAAQAKECDNSGTVSTSSKREGETSTSTQGKASASENDEESKLGAAAALSPADEGGTKDGTGAAAAPPLVNGDVAADLAVMDIEVDEDLFDEELDEELENLDLN